MAKGTTVAAINAAVRGDVSKFDGDLKPVQRVLERHAKKWVSSLKRYGAIAKKVLVAGFKAAAVAVTAAFASISVVVKRSIDDISKFTSVANVLGTKSVKDVQVLEAVARNIGLEFDTAADSVVDFQRKLADSLLHGSTEAREALLPLGLTIEEVMAEGAIKGIVKVREALKNAKLTAAERSQIIDQLAGGDIGINDLFTRGDFAGAQKLIDSIGGGLDDKVAGDIWNISGQMANLGTVVDTLGRKFTQGYVPELNKALEEYQKISGVDLGSEFVELGEQAAKVTVIFADLAITMAKFGLTLIEKIDAGIKKAAEKAHEALNPRVNEGSHSVRRQRYEQSMQDVVNSGKGALGLGDMDETLLRLNQKYQDAITTGLSDKEVIARSKANDLTGDRLTYKENTDTTPVSTLGGDAMTKGIEATNQALLDSQEETAKWHSQIRDLHQSLDPNMFPDPFMGQKNSIADMRVELDILEKSGERAHVPFAKIREELDGLEAKAKAASMEALNRQLDDATASLNGTLDPLRQYRDLLESTKQKMREAGEAAPQLQRKVKELEDGLRVAALRSTAEWQTFESLGIAAIDNFVETGKFSIKNFVRDMLKELAKLYIRQALFTGIFGSAGIFPQIGAGLGGGAAPGRSAGGPVTAGQGYRVGEIEPELFVPHTNGNIIPSRSMEGMGENITVNIYNEGDINADTDAKIENAKVEIVDVISELNRSGGSFGRRRR